MELLLVTQHNMERILPGITLRDHLRNTWIRHQTGVNDIIDVIKKGILVWVGFVARFKTTGGQKSDSVPPREWTRRQGRPNTRCRDNLIHHLGSAWSILTRVQHPGRGSSGRGSSLRNDRNPRGKWSNRLYGTIFF